MASLLELPLDALSLANDVPTSDFPSSLDAFALGAKLGSGATATVFQATAANGAEVALKLVGRPDQAVTYRPVSNVPLAFAAEQRALDRVRHPNVMKLLAANDDVQHAGRRARMLVLEHCPNGELFGVLDKLHALPERVARTLAHQLWGAVAACHDQGVGHRDIKPENILLAADWSLRLADFGFATGPDDPGASTASVGTPGYMAPELLAHTNTRHPHQADVWSAGVCTFILLMGNPPVASASTTCWFYRRLKNRQFAEFWRAHERHAPTLDPAAKQMLQRMLDVALRGRPTAHQVLSDEAWMQQPVLTAEELRHFLESSMHGDGHE